MAQAAPEGTARCLVGPSTSRGHLDRCSERTEVGATVRPVDDVTPIVLGGLAKLDADDITVAVVDVPGRAVVVTRACYNELLEKNPR